jgi:hypothetical protein
MGRNATRSVFAAALCAGVAMVGASVHGMLGVDAELQRSALAAHQQKQQAMRVLDQQDRDCDGQAPAPQPQHHS